MSIFICILTILLSALFGYLSGSIPNAVIIGKIFFKRDPRLEGSKNSGGTNAGRVFGLKIGIIVIILDVLKIVIPFIITFLVFTKVDYFKKILFYSEEINAFGRGNTLQQLAYWITPFTGIIGHCYSIYIKFTGGKAVSSYIGFAISSSWIACIILPLTFFTSIKIGKKVSIASMVSACLFTIISWIIYIIYIIYGPKIANYLMFFGVGPEICIYYPTFLTLCLALLILKHKANIKRIIVGNEPIAYWLDKNK